MNKKEKFYPGDVIGIRFSDDDKIMQNLRPVVVLSSYWGGNSYKVVPLTSSSNRYEDYGKRISKNSAHLYIESTDSLARLDCMMTISKDTIVYPYFKDGMYLTKVSKRELLGIHKRIHELDRVDQLLIKVQDDMIDFKIGDNVEFRLDQAHVIIDGEVIDEADDQVDIYVQSIQGNAMIEPGSRLLVNKEDLYLALTKRSLNKPVNESKELDLNLEMEQVGIGSCSKGYFD